MRSDNEAVFRKLKSLLAQIGIYLELVPPGTHESVAERKARQIREAIRTYKAELAYVLPKKLTGEIVGAWTTSNGKVPNIKTHPKTPDQLITGRKPVMPKQFLQFGTPVLAVEPNVQSRSKAAPRADFGIVVDFIGGDSYKVYFKNGRALERKVVQVLKHLPSEFGWPARDVTPRETSQKRRRVQATDEQEPSRPAHYPSSMDVYQNDEHLEGTEREAEEMYEEYDYYSSNVPVSDMSGPLQASTTSSTGTPLQENQSSSPFLRQASEEV
jgi:hypothetical protein